MLADQFQRVTSGNLTAGPKPDDSIKSVIAFIEYYFKKFARDSVGQITMNEKGLSQKLCILLNRHAKQCPLFFHSEYMEDIISGISPQIDIGTIHENENITISDREYGANDSFFSIEAKRLPTPGTNREKEYVIGITSPSGAIERFKKGLHGPILKYAAIIGYVQNENFSHWFLKINSWIQALVSDDHSGFWVDSDKLISDDLTDPLLAKLHSIHSRIEQDSNGSNISVYHFWVNLIPSA